MYSNEKDLIIEIIRFMRFSSCAYGWKLILAFMRRGTLGKLFRAIKNDEIGNKLALSVHCELDVEVDQCLLEHCWRSTEKIPGYFIVLDHRSKSIVVAVRFVGKIWQFYIVISLWFRGTFHTWDVCTDLTAHYEPFMKGKAHEGIAKAAKSFVEKIKDLLLRTVQEHYGYRIVFCGHSLGGGVAVLSTLLLRAEIPETTRVLCFAFGAPPVVSWELACACRPFICNIVMRNDVICRLCYGSVKDLLQLARRALSNAGTIGERLRMLIASGQSNSRLLQRMFKLTKPISIEPLNEQQKAEKLYLAGTVLHLNNRKHLESSQTDNLESTRRILYANLSIGWQLSWRDAKELTELQLVKNMFSDHLPDRYETALEYLLEDEETRKKATVTGWKTIGPRIVFFATFGSLLMCIGYIVWKRTGVRIQRPTH